ncbi:hypothetical protein ADL09_14225 [Streptomyces sp. NRRL F-7442]|nr:hypothetical protein ADL09_14225 [Streptomyces sp. NRRL F-7442]
MRCDGRPARAGWPGRRGPLPRGRRSSGRQGGEFGVGALGDQREDTAGGGRVLRGDPAPDARGDGRGRRGDGGDQLPPVVRRDQVCALRDEQPLGQQVTDNGPHEPSSTRGRPAPGT